MNQSFRVRIQLPAFSLTYSLPRSFFKLCQIFLSKSLKFLTIPTASEAASNQPTKIFIDQQPLFLIISSDFETALFAILESHGNLDFVAISFELLGDFLKGVFLLRASSCFIRLISLYSHRFTRMGRDSVP